MMPAIRLTSRLTLFILFLLLTAAIAVGVRIVEKVSSALEAGQSVLVFPEGTTTIGITVLPFHRRLLNAAIDANVPIQPISIGYRRHNRPDHLAPFIGDDEFQPHLLRILKQPAVDVTLVFHEPVRASAEGPITDLADSLHKTVAAGLADIHRGGSDASSSSLASLT